MLRSQAWLNNVKFRKQAVGGQFRNEWKIPVT